MYAQRVQQQLQNAFTAIAQRPVVEVRQPPTPRTMKNVWAETCPAEPFDDRSKYMQEKVALK